MNFDLDIYREFLIYLSNNLILNDYGYCEPINPNEPLPNREQLAEITNGEISFLIREFRNNGLIETKEYAHQAIPMVTGFTLEGYRLAKAINNENIWSELTEKSKLINSLKDLIFFFKK